MFWQESLIEGEEGSVQLTSLCQLVILQILLVFLWNKLPQWGGQVYWYFPTVGIPWFGYLYLNSRQKPDMLREAIQCRQLPKLYSIKNNFKKLDWQSKFLCNKDTFLPIMAYIILWLLSTKIVELVNHENWQKQLFFVFSKNFWTFNNSDRFRLGGY